jgi:pimeloyl-ACP methyl ester carboxylesterase
MARRFGLLAVLVAIAGCGGGGQHSAASKRTTQGTPAAGTARPRCGDPAVTAHAIRFRTSDGVTLSGALVGSGPVGAVLIHEYPRDLCGWWPYARYLSQHGVRALAFDLRCFGDSPCPNGRGHAVRDVAAAMAELRRRGARQVALVGASMGGAIAVVAAAQLHPAAVVDLSGERDTTALTPGIDANAGAAAHGVTAPALFAVAREDRYVPVPDMRAVAGSVRSPTKRVIVLPAAAGHGWDLLFGTTTKWSPLAATVAAFIRRHAGGGRSAAAATANVERCIKPGPTTHVVQVAALGGPIVTIGSGRTAAVMANQDGGNLCEWLPLVRGLARAGMRAAVFDYVGAGTDDQVLAIAKALRREGARRVSLVGASTGGRLVLHAAAERPHQFDSVVTLSAEQTGRTGYPTLSDARHLRLPALYVGTREDGYTTFAAETRRLYRATTAPGRKLLLLPGAAHGTAILAGDQGQRVIDAITAFIRG